MRSIWKSNIKLPLGNDFTKNVVMPRCSVVLLGHVDRKILVHTGHKLVRIYVNSEMVGHKFGEFAVTRKRCVHKKVQRSKSLK